jgi:sugar lactone lactonase YvrE
VKRPFLIAALALLVLLIIGALTFWRWHLHVRERLPDFGWAAVKVVLAGDGVAGVRDGDATRARFSDPFGVAVAADGTIYVSDAGDAQRIRRITPDGVVSSFAGGEPGYAEGPGRSARFSTPSGLAIDAAGVLYVADTGNNAIRRITPDGMVSTLAGGGLPGFQDGVGVNARFNGPVGVAIDSGGRLIVADTYNDRIRTIAPDGTVSTLAGSGVRGSTDAAALDAEFDTPCGVAIDAAGNIYVADTGSGAVRTISASGMVSTRHASVAALNRPIGIAVSALGGIYVSDERGFIFELAPDGSVREVTGVRAGSDDEGFRALGGLAMAGPRSLVVTDPRSAVVALVASPSAVGLRPPVTPGLSPSFDVEAFAAQPLLWPFHPLAGPFEVTGTLGEPRGGETGERFHAGLDVHAPEGTLVRAVRNGVVSSPLPNSGFGTLNESVRIGPLVYVHLRVGRERTGQILDPSRFVPTYDDTGRLIDVRTKRGARFTTGDRVGSVNGFYHVHLNVGWPGEEYNPLRFSLVQFEDTVPPTIRRGGVRVFGEDGEPLTARQKGRLLVDGRLQVVVDAWDQVNGNEPRRRLGLYRLGYQVLNRDGSPAPGFEVPRETIRFDRLTEASEARLIFASGSGIPFYRGGSTRFLYVVTSTLRDGIAATDTWDTATLPPGDYTLRILAADINGNEAIANRDLAITKVLSSGDAGSSRGGSRQ